MRIRTFLGRIQSVRMLVACSPALSLIDIVVVDAWKVRLARWEAGFNKVQSVPVKTYWQQIESVLEDAHESKHSEYKDMRRPLC